MCEEDDDDDDADLVMTLMLQESLGVQHSRYQQEAQQSQQDVHDVHQVQPSTQGSSTGAAGSGLRGSEERPSVSTLSTQRRSSTQTTTVSFHLEGWCP